MIGMDFPEIKSMALNNKILSEEMIQKIKTTLVNYLNVYFFIIYEEYLHIFKKRIL